MSTFVYYGPENQDGRSQYGIKHGDFGVQEGFGIAETHAAAKVAAESLAATRGMTVQELTSRGTRRAATPSAWAAQENAIAAMQAAVCKGGAFSGTAVNALPALSAQNIAMGRLADWLTDEPVGTPGVFAASAAAAKPLAAGEAAAFVIVSAGGQLIAMTVEEAFSRHLRETVEGVEWHANSGARAVASRITL